MNPDQKLLQEMAADLEAEQTLYGLLQKTQIVGSRVGNISILGYLLLRPLRKRIVAGWASSGKIELVWSAKPEDLTLVKCRAVIEKVRQWLVRTEAPITDLEAIDVKLGIIGLLSVDARRVAMKDVCMIAYQHTKRSTF